MRRAHHRVIKFMTTSELKIISEQIADFQENMLRKLDLYETTMQKMIEQSIKFTELLTEVANAIGKH